MQAMSLPKATHARRRNRNISRRRPVLAITIWNSTTPSFWCFVATLLPRKARCWGLYESFNAQEDRKLEIRMKT
jgi:hypothetical protein